MRKTISDLDKEVAVLQTQLISHMEVCEDLSEQTLSRIKRLEIIFLAFNASLLALLLRLVFMS